MIEETEVVRKYKQGDDDFCTINGIRFCNKTRNDKNYALNYVVCILLDFIIPLLSMQVFSALLMSDAFPVVLIPPIKWLVLGGSHYVAFIIIALLMITLTCIGFYRIGPLSFVPICMGIITVILGLFPPIGELIAYILAIIPWWTIMTTVHLIAFSLSRPKGEL